MRVMHLIWCLFLSGFVAAQKIQTIVPQQPVVIGTAFQVQYIITDPSGLTNLSDPIFKDFTKVSGPNHYKGKVIIDGKMQSIENVTYTLVPEKTGHLIVPGIHATFELTAAQKSEDVLITVVPKPKLSFQAKSSYTEASLYAPSSRSDLEKLVNENLFIRAEVNKKTCYVGEPVIATFKLYSRLQSSSELVRVPGLYGFSVIDILDIRESHQAVETINGKVFNTSILRKVQLYPELPGQLVIDEMVVKNEIEFDDSLDNDKKTIIQKELRSKPVVISVQPLPGKHPLNYTGAVGQFLVSSALDKNKIGVNEQARMVVTISGQGNFIQLGEPIIQWPEGLEVFDPSITDELNTAVVPAQGKRTYIYGISSDSAATYTIPAVSYSYFNLAKDSFQKLTTQALTLSIQKSSGSSSIIKEKKGAHANRTYLWLAGAGLAALLAGLVIWSRKKKKSKPVAIFQVEPVIPISRKMESLDLSNLTDREVCIRISKLLAEMEKHYPVLSTEKQLELRSIKNDCQLMAYSNMEIQGRKEIIKERARKLAISLET